MSGEPTEDVDTAADAAALASFNEGYSQPAEPTTTPVTPVEQPSTEAPSKEAEPPKPFSVSEEDWRSLQSKMSTLDKIDEYGRKIDTIAGHVGGLKQSLDTLRQRGATKVEKAQLKRLSEQYPELADALAEDIGAILSAPSGAGIDSSEIDKRVQAAIAADRVDRQKEWLSDKHPDWVDVLRSDDFKAFQLTLTPAENQALMASVDGRLVEKHIAQFKELKAKADTLKTATPATKPQATPAPTTPPRRSRMEAAVPAKGTGGAPPAPDPADEFNKGFALKGKA